MDFLNCDSQTLYEKSVEFKNNNDYTNFIMYLTHAANLGNSLAIKTLFDDYQNDKNHLKQDLEISKPFYEKTNEYSYSLNYLGFISKDEDKKYEYWLKSYEEYGNPIAAFNLSQNKNINNNKKLMYLIYASEKGFGYASSILAIEFYDRDDKEKALTYSRLSVEQGYKEGLSVLASLYCLKKNYKMAAEIYQEGHNCGDINSTVGLAFCYYYGRGVQQDYEIVKNLLENIKDTYQASVLLGRMYLDGKAVTQDWDKAFYYFEIGEKYNILESMLDLADLLREPGGNYQMDYERAKNIYEKIISTRQDGYYKIMAYNELATMYSIGQIKADLDTRVSLTILNLEKSANLGSDEAKYRLGRLYYSGKDGIGVSVKQDYKEAKEMFESMENKKYAFTLLGEIYEFGKGCEINLMMARECYEKDIVLKGYCFNTLTNLINVYKKLGDQIDRDEVIEFLFENGEERYLKEVYNFTKEDIENHRIIRENRRLKLMILKKNEKFEFVEYHNFKDENDFLKNLAGSYCKDEYNEMMRSDEEKKNNKCVIM